MRIRSEWKHNTGPPEKTVLRGWTSSSTYIRPELVEVRQRRAETLDWFTNLFFKGLKIVSDLWRASTKFNCYSLPTLSSPWEKLHPSPISSQFKRVSGHLWMLLTMYCGRWATVTQRDKRKTYVNDESSTHNIIELLLGESRLHRQGRREDLLWGATSEESLQDIMERPNMPLE